jgi:hypothetical protein
MQRGWVGVGGGLLSIALVACGAADEAAGRLLEDAGELLADAGQVIADAGQAMADAGAGPSGHADAQVQAPAAGTTSETFEVACADKYVQISRHTASGTTIKTTQRVAEVAAASPERITGIDALVCGYEGPQGGTCPSDYTCEGTSAVVFGDCSAGVFTLDKGTVRVFCGTTTETNGEAATAQRWKTARITIRR